MSKTRCECKPTLSYALKCLSPTFDGALKHYVSWTVFSDHLNRALAWRTGRLYIRYIREIMCRHRWQLDYASYKLYGLHGCWRWGCLGRKHSAMHGAVRTSATGDKLRC